MENSFVSDATQDNLFEVNAMKKLLQENFYGWLFRIIKECGDESICKCGGIIRPSKEEGGLYCTSCGRVKDIPQVS